MSHSHGLQPHTTGQLLQQAIEQVKQDLKQDLFHLFKHLLEEPASGVGLKAKKSMMSVLPRCFPKLLQAPEAFACCRCTYLCCCDVM